MQRHAKRTNIYQDITNHIIAEIEAGAGMWQMPWHTAGGASGIPHNAFTGRTYRGANVIVLWAVARRRGYASDVWATYRQWQQLGAQVRKGERSTAIVFYKPIERTDTTEAAEHDDEDDSDTSYAYIARAHRVFNAAQVSGWEQPAVQRCSLVASLAAADRFVARSGAEIRHGGDRAYYAPVRDYIQLPEPARFVGSETSGATESYYATALHELVHWTGHPGRLDRGLTQHLGREAYAMEELVAELGAAFLCAQLEITNTPRPDHAAYLAHWLTVLRRDARAFFTAARRATEATDYLAMMQESMAIVPLLKSR